MHSAESLDSHIALSSRVLGGPPFACLAVGIGILEDLQGPISSCGASGAGIMGGVSTGCTVGHTTSGISSSSKST